MNPVLLKPEADAQSQVVVLGKLTRKVKAGKYYEYAPYLLEIIEDSLKKLRSSYDIVVIEGAGSPAEINFREREVVNMRVAKLAHAPVLLAGDIDRGGVFAALVGTLKLLTREERTLVKGLIINKFRGDIELLKPGLKLLEQHTRKPVLGVIPYFHDIFLAQEDSVFLDERPTSSDNGNLRIAIIRLPHVSNYDDFDPFEVFGCTVNYVSNPPQLGNPDLIILPGTKTTIADLRYLQQNGLAKAIIQKVKSGTPIVGTCGGYQMMGKKIIDPHNIESKEGSAEGLGLLDNETIFHNEKITTQVKAQIVADNGLLQNMKGVDITGYEIHMGQTSSQNCLPAFKIVDTPSEYKDYIDGAISNDGLILGTYIHGLFHNQEFTRAFISRLRQLRGLSPTPMTAITRQEQYDKLASLVRENLDMKQVYRITLGRRNG
jgi:adenosylcobyric acid synthase